MCDRLTQLQQTAKVLSPLTRDQSLTSVRCKVDVDFEAFLFRKEGENTIILCKEEFLASIFILYILGEGVGGGWWLEGLIQRCCPSLETSSRCMTTMHYRIAVGSKFVPLIPRYWCYSVFVPLVLMHPIFYV